MSNSSQRISLIVRKTIPASADRLFDAWTRAEQLRSWWGPAGVECTEAEVDLRVGGRYKLANRLPDGTVIWIRGEFLEISRPHKLVYTWSTDPVDDTTGDDEAEQVTVRFETHGASTEVIVVHERVTPEQRDGHELGWVGCLDGLIDLVSSDA
jgi:uncharacterized protein YndB with AHSA1/START domain